MNKSNTLTPDALHIIKDKGTEFPNSGIYNLTDVKGTYLCRQCGKALFRSTQKFISSCGWPSFDDEIKGCIKRELDSDGRRTEILCQNCNAHLGHVFEGESHTEKNLRYCVNSLSIDFVENETVLDTEEGIFAAGCFWGVQRAFDELEGVVKTEVGYIGGHVENPTYELVCQGKTGHLEAVRVVYDSDKLDYKTLVSHFFQIHDPTQKNRQGVDVGEQYSSAIFYLNDQQKEIAQLLKDVLSEKANTIATKLLSASVFWQAEAYHQDYFKKDTAG